MSTGWRDGVADRPRRRLVVAVAMFPLLAAATCSDLQSFAEGDVIPVLTPVAHEDAGGFEHVHGLGVNAGDGQLYVATHHGLWRVAEGAEPTRVGEARHDLMGFAVVGADHFVASGHPAEGEDRVPSHLGFIESRDAGLTWRSVSLLGSADFHTLRPAHDLFYGYDGTSQTLLVSDDGNTWERRGQVRRLVDFVVDPADPDHLVAAVAKDLTTTELMESVDGGASWQRVDGPPAQRFAWADADALFAVTADGAMLFSSDSAKTWEQRGDIGARPGALYADEDVVYAAAGGAVLASDDGARTWRVVRGSR